MTGRRYIVMACAGSALVAAMFPAQAGIALSQSSFEAGQNFAAFFKIDSGCDGSPTTLLRVEIPGDVTVLNMPPKPGWAVKAEQKNGRTTGVTWTGKLEAKSADQFGLFVKLPARIGALYFPVLQRCDKGETNWSDIPKNGQAWRDVPHPAPVLQLVASDSPAHYTAGNIMVEQVWSPATPNGATTAAAYLTIMNHGAAADILLGGTMVSGGKLDIHQMSMTGGTMTMRPVPDGVTIPAGATVTLSPQGSYHLMVSGLKAPLVQGTRVPATFNFAKAGPLQVELEIAAIGARAPKPGNVTGAIPGAAHH